MAYIILTADRVAQEVVESFQLILELFEIPVPAGAFFEDTLTINIRDSNGEHFSIVALL